MKQVEQIIDLLNDPSFPRMVLLDGAWGSGKTHFIKQHLLARFERQFKVKVYFFSLYGISSIDDFRDKIISLTISESEETSLLGRYFSKVADGVSNNLGERGVGSVINGLAGAYKYKLYGELDDCVLVLDDLERVSDNKVIRNILGECLGLAESKNIRVLVVANEDKLTCKDDVEKVFADKYNFSFSHEEVVDILQDGIEGIDEVIARELLLNITSIDSRNIRVLKRALGKIMRLKIESEKVENIIIDQAMSRIVGSVVRICYAKFERGFSKEDIVGSIRTRVVRSISKKKGEAENVEYKMLDDMLGDSVYGMDNKLVDYCCDGVFNFTDLREELSLPVKSSLLDAMKSPWTQNQLSDDEFKEGLVLIEGLIANPEGVGVDEWFYACDNYIFMVDHKVFEKPLLSKSELIRKCQDIDERVFKKQNYRAGFDRVISDGFYNQEIFEIFQLKKELVIKLALNNINEVFLSRFVESWRDVEDEIYREKMHKPIYHEIDDKHFESAITKWSNDELFQFVRFNIGRYKFSNIESFFESEIDSLTNICKVLDKLIVKLGYGLKVASMINLRDCFNDACTRMKDNLNQP